MVGMKMVSVLLLGLCLFVGVVHGFTVDQPDDAWRFSVDGNTVNEDKQGGRLVDNGFQYSFEQYDAGVAGNANQFAENTFADLPDASADSYNQVDANTFSDSSQYSTEGSSFGNEEYVYNARLQQDNAAPYDYNNQFSTQSDDPASTSYALGVPEERGASSQEYVYDARAGIDGASFTTLDTQGSTDDAATSSDVATSADGASFSTVDSPPLGDQAVAAAGHNGPVSFYTPASETDGAFRFYDAQSDEEKNATSVLDEDPASGAASFSQLHDESTDIAFASTSSAQGTHGCPNTYVSNPISFSPLP